MFCWVHFSCLVCRGNTQHYDAACFLYTAGSGADLQLESLVGLKRLELVLDEPRTPGGAAEVCAKSLCCALHVGPCSVQSGAQLVWPGVGGVHQG
jgi:hypothetical protein